MKAQDCKLKSILPQKDVSIKIIVESDQHRCLNVLHKKDITLEFTFVSEVLYVNHHVFIVQKQ
jgi:hypothetical protein